MYILAGRLKAPSYLILASHETPHYRLELLGQSSYQVCWFKRHLNNYWELNSSKRDKIVIRLKYDSETRCRSVRRMLICASDGSAQCFFFLSLHNVNSTMAIKNREIANDLNMLNYKPLCKGYNLEISIRPQYMLRTCVNFANRNCLRH